MTIALRDLPGDPITDPFRLAAVLNSGLLDTEPEASFDDLTRLAAMLIGAPFAFATIVDDRRSFWKSRFGIPADGPNQNTIEESFCQYVVSSQRELVVGNAATDERTRANPSVKKMGVAAWAGFPLLDPSGEVLGTFCVVDTRTREWSAAELDILETLARIASREIARQIMMNDERAAHARSQALTHSLQASLLPPELPAVDGLDIAACFHPAGLGLDLVGDFYDLFPTRDGWSFVLGDVCGKGIDAAKAATLARHAVGAACISATDPVDVMRAFNETFIARRDNIDLFLTAVYGTLERTSDGCRICLACAGHLPPVVRRADGTSYALDVNGPLIGIFSDLHIARTDVHLAPGESLIIYTDGVSEARGNGDLYGEDAVHQIIATLPSTAGASTIATTIERSAVAFSGGVATDDIAVIVIHVPALA